MSQCNEHYRNAAMLEMLRKTYGTPLSNAWERHMDDHMKSKRTAVMQLLDANAEGVHLTLQAKIPGHTARRIREILRQENQVSRSGGVLRPSFSSSWNLPLE
jgi:hypothetical protein